MTEEQERELYGLLEAAKERINILD